MMGPGLLPSVGGGPPSVHSHHASVYSLHTLIERVEGDLNAPSKDALDRVSRGSESLDEDDTSPLPPLTFPTSPLPTFTPTTATTSAAPAMTASTTPPSRHLKNISVSSQPTHAIKPSTPSPSYTPPHSASSSPAQIYTRPPQLHKKSESVAAMPSRMPYAPDSGSRRPEGRSKGRIVAHHGPSPSVSVAVGPAPPGWI